MFLSNQHNSKTLYKIKAILHQKFIFQILSNLKFDSYKRNVFNLLV